VCKRKKKRRGGKAEKMSVKVGEERECLCEVGREVNR